MGLHVRPRRAAALLVAAGAAALASGTAAFGHASIPAASNPAGRAANPYPAGSQQTVKFLVPFEQEGVTYNGAPNTTVAVKILAPTGWTAAGCGEARKADLSAVVGGWTCGTSAEGGRALLSWAGPQVAASASADDSAQYFTFTIKVPSPAALTAYGGTGSAADGFRVVQKYADGATSTWRTPNDAGAGEVAQGMVRTVAAAGAAAGSPTPAPAASTPPSVTPAATATPAATPKPTGIPAAGGGSGTQTIVADVDDDGLPHTGGSVPGGLLLATAGVLAAGFVLLGCSLDTAGRRR